MWSPLSLCLLLLASFSASTVTCITRKHTTSGFFDDGSIVRAMRELRRPSPLSLHPFEAGSIFRSVKDKLTNTHDDGSVRKSDSDIHLDQIGLIDPGFAMRFNRRWSSSSSSGPLGGLAGGSAGAQGKPPTPFSTNQPPSINKHPTEASKQENAYDGPKSTPPGSGAPIFPSGNLLGKTYRGSGQRPPGTGSPSCVGSGCNPPTTRR